jgi:MFS family permease
MTTDPHAAPAPPHPAPAHDPYQALRHPEYRWFLLGSLALTMAMQIQTAVLGWQVYALTHDPLSLGLVGLAEALPFLGLTLYGGYVADRASRRSICARAQGALLLCAAGLLAASWGGGIRVVAVLYAAQVVSGLARAFYRPAYLALAAELVPREVYANASTWRSGGFHFAQVAGPALGGLLLRFGYRAAYGAELVLMLVGLCYFPLIRSRSAGQPAVGGNAGTSSLREVLARLGEGVRFVFAQKIVLGAMSLDLFAVLFGGAPALLPIFARDVLHVGAVGFGWLRAAPALGSVLVSIWLAHRPAPGNTGRTLLLCVAGFGLCWIAFPFSRWYGLSLLLLAVSGGFDNVSVVVRATLVQSFTPPHLMGRVSAVNGFFIGSSNELGAFESGVAARVLGLVPSVVFGGVMTLLTVAVTAWRAVELRRLKRM